MLRFCMFNGRINLIQLSKCSQCFKVWRCNLAQGQLGANYHKCTRPGYKHRLIEIKLDVTIWHPKICMLLILMGFWGSFSKKMTLNIILTLINILLWIISNNVSLISLSLVFRVLLKSLISVIGDWQYYAQFVFLCPHFVGI